MDLSSLASALPRVAPSTLRVQHTPLTSTASSEPPSPACAAFFAGISNRKIVDTSPNRPTKGLDPGSSATTGRTQSIPRRLLRPRNCIPKKLKTDVGFLRCSWVPERDKRPDEPRPFVEEYFKNDFLYATSRMQMLSGVVNTRITEPLTVFDALDPPVKVTVDVSQLPKDAISPTHVIALRSGRPNESTRYFPIHALPLLAHCLDVPNVTMEARTGPTTSLPILSLTAPSPATFHILVDFFYRLHLPTLSKALLPVDGELFREVAKKEWPRTPEAAARIYAQTMSVGELSAAARRVYGVYENACALGMWDEGLWAAITMAWTIILLTRSLLKGGMMGHQRRSSA